MPPLTRIESRAVLLATDDIDTDQIIPARFLKTTERRGLGTHLFADWRYAADGTPRSDFILNAPGASERRILVGGRNFGCGSSREHAPWALADFGFQAVVAPSFADIFRNNALKNGIVPVQLDREAHAALVEHLALHPDVVAVVDVASQRLLVGQDTWGFALAPFARHCLLEGIDQLGFLLGADDEIARYEQSHPAAISTLA
ncbi:MAG: 3-isopropylmalate dehydratase small subunit [Gemmatimonadetes bacterium]|nr:3-isopropylmalate dehydratase small subunit [Gemmatimonadota bacterium]